MRMTIAAGLLVAAVWIGAQQKRTPFKGGAVAVAELATTARVEKVDKKAKTVTIKDAAGKRVRIEVPPEVHDLADVRKGQLIKVRYLQSAALTLGKPGVPPAVVEDRATLVPKNGGQGEVVVNTRLMTGTVVDVDQGGRKVRIKSPNGSTRTLDVPEAAQGFEQAKVGDTVAVHYTEAVALAAEPQRKNATPSR